MGLLDEAIREHLDLKRRRGADPTEVERAEREALGPVRRNREAPAASELGDDQGAGGFAYDQAGEENSDDADGEERPFDDHPEDGPALPPLALAGETVSDPRSRLEPTVDQPSFDQSSFGESAFEEPAFDDEPPPRFAHGATGGETSEFDVEEALTAGEESDEDVLGETPEFLQDTPDHDRLWFEQRPPKDFDFDG